MVTIKTRSVMDTMQNIESSQNNITESSSANIEEFGNKPTSRELNAQRINELLDSCKDEVLKQIIGPFGLNKVMFNDKDGGNVTTLHNFEQGIVATDDDQDRLDEWQTAQQSLNRAPHDVLKNQVKKEKYQQMNEGDHVVDGYTGKKLGTKINNKIDKNGSIHADHLESVSQIEKDSKNHLFAKGNSSQERQDDRVRKSGDKRNIVLTDGGLNCSKSDKDLMDFADSKVSKKHAKETGNPNMTNKEYYDMDKERITTKHKIAKKFMKQEQFVNQITKQGQELLQTGWQEAKVNALRQAMGLVLHELVNSSYVEVKRIAKDPDLKENFVDNIILAMKNTINKIINKSEHIFKSIISGGIQGFISNLLTFIINNIITTSKKIGSIIREGLKGLWKAIKLITNPPDGMSGIEIARQATKIITVVITTSLGLFFEKSIENFIVSIPIFAPLAPIISPAVTALLTGIMTAFVMFDKFFDWLNDAGTERLNAQIEHMEASVGLFENMAQMMNSQFNNSKQYKLCADQYEQMKNTLSGTQYNISSAVVIMENTIQGRASTIQIAHSHINKFEFINEEDIDSALNNILNLNKV